MRAILFALTLSGLFLISASAQDWPMFQGNPQHTGYTNLTGDLSDFLVTWEYTAQNGIFGSPAVGDINGDGEMEIVVPLEKTVGSGQESIVALDRNGKELWKFRTRGGVHSSPTIADVNGDGNMDVVFGTNDAELFALRGGSGREIWSVDNIVGAFRSSPLVYDLDNDNNFEVYIGSQNKGLYAIDGESGIPEWNYQTGGGVSSSPTLGDFDGDGDLEIAFGSEDGLLYVVEGNGSLSWSLNLSSPVIFSTPTPLPDGDGLVVGTEDRGLLIIDKMKVSKTFKTDASISGSPAVAVEGNETIIVFGTAIEEDLHGVYVKYSENKIYAINDKGEMLWEKATGGWSVFSSPALADIDRDGKLEVVIGTREGRLYILEAETGVEEWSYLKGTGIFASPVLVDIDEDRDLEIIVAYRFSNQVKLINSPDKPDLLVGAIEFSNEFPRDHDDMNITINIKNRGKITTNNSTVSVYRRSPILDHLIKNLSVDGLEAGEDVNISFKWEALLPPGQLGIYAAADPSDEIDESDETNNGKYKEFPNDLIISSHTFPEEIQESSAKATVTVDLRITNKGKMAFEGVEAVLLWGNETDPREIGKKSVDIAAGGHIDVEFSFNFVPTNFDRILSIVIDPENEFDEIREDNNVVKWVVEPKPVIAPVTLFKEDGEGPDKDLIIMILLLVVVLIVVKKFAKKIKRKPKKEEKKEGEKEEVKEEQVPIGGMAADEAREEDEEKDIHLIKIGGEPGATHGDPELEELHRRKDKIKKMMDIAKRKYYKRQISEDSYKDLTVRNQEKIIEIEAEIEKRTKGS